MLVGHPCVQVGIVGLLLDLPLELRELDRLLLAHAGADRLQDLVEIRQIALLEVGLLDVEAVGDRPVGRESAAVGHEHLDQGIVAEPLEHVTGVKLGLAIGHLAVIGLLGADEAQVDRVEVQELAARHSLQEHPVPLLGPGKALALDGERLGVPVGDVELGLLQGDHVNQLVGEHPCPVERHPGGPGAGQGHDPAGAGADRGHERQADRPAAEPLVVLEDLDLAPARRRVAEPRGQRRVDRFEIARHVTAQQIVLGGVDHDAEMRRIDAGVAGHVPEDLDHVVGADVERVGVEGGVEEALGLGLAADLHVEHAQADGGIGAGGVGGGGQQEGSLGRVILAAIGEPLAQGGVEGRGPWGCSPGRPARRRPPPRDRPEAGTRPPAAPRRLHHAGFRRRPSRRRPWRRRIARRRY